ncbi:hypothetical protein K9M41_02895 [Candidatus Gracilibacteria bacterium]|nr:hypothetical protein [Candidatus Gracilibacteria bacterium]
MRKIMIAFVLGLFLIPSWSFAQIAGPTSQASYWNKLKKKNTPSISTRSVRRTNYNESMRRMSDRIEIKAGERDVMEEKMEVEEKKIMPPRPEPMDDGSTMMRPEEDHPVDVMEKDYPDMNDNDDSELRNLEEKLKDIR